MNQSQANPSSQFYAGPSGAAYFEAYQEPIAVGGTFLNVPLFRPFVTADDTLVDFACGSGQLLRLLPGRRKLGIETNAIAAAAARSWGLELVEQIEDVPDELADVVISNHGLEHTLEPYRVLGELRRITRPGGRLVLFLPADVWWKGASYRPGDVDHHLYTWTPLLLGHLLGEAGWTVDTVKLSWHSWPPRYYARLRRLPERAAQAICRLTSLVRLRPQIHAVATKGVG